MLSRMFWPDYPVPVGVLRAVPRPTHDQLIEQQISAAVAARARAISPRRSRAARPGPSSDDRGGGRCAARHAASRTCSARTSATTAARTSPATTRRSRATTFRGQLLGEHLDALERRPTGDRSTSTADVDEAIRRMHDNGIDCVLVDRRRAARRDLHRPRRGPEGRRAERRGPPDRRR